jgi:hypothetical protein
MDQNEKIEIATSIAIAATLIGLKVNRIIKLRKTAQVVPAAPKTKQEEIIERLKNLQAANS